MCQDLDIDTLYTFQHPSLFPLRILHIQIFFFKYKIVIKYLFSKLHVTFLASFTPHSGHPFKSYILGNLLHGSLPWRAVISPSPVGLYIQQGLFHCSDKTIRYCFYSDLKSTKILSLTLQNFLVMRQVLVGCMQIEFKAPVSFKASDKLQSGGT